MIVRSVTQLNETGDVTGPPRGHCLQSETVEVLTATDIILIRVFRLVEAFLSETDYKFEKLIVDGGVAR